MLKNQQLFEINKYIKIELESNFDLIMSGYADKKDIDRIYNNLSKPNKVLKENGHESFLDERKSKGRQIYDLYKKRFDKQKKIALEI